MFHFYQSLKSDLLLKQSSLILCQKVITVVSEKKIVFNCFGESGKINHILFHILEKINLHFLSTCFQRVKWEHPTPSLYLKSNH